VSDDSVKERILREATRSFAEKGFGSTSVREVVEAAGVTKPTLYYWFENKEALFLEAVRIRVEALHACTLDAVRGPGTPRERLARFTRNIVRLYATDADGMKMIMVIHHKPEDGRPAVDMISVYKANRLLLLDLIREGMATGEFRADLDPDDVALALIGMLNFRCAIAMNRGIIPEDLADRIIALLNKGIQA
jgi:TetR/AcrR family transcriptional regulator